MSLGVFPVDGFALALYRAELLDPGAVFLDESVEAGYLAVARELDAQGWVVSPS